MLTPAAHITVDAAMIVTPKPEDRGTFRVNAIAAATLKAQTRVELRAALSTTSSPTKLCA